MILCREAGERGGNGGTTSDELGAEGARRRGSSPLRIRVFTPPLTVYTPCRVFSKKELSSFEFMWPTLELAPVRWKLPDKLPHDCDGCKRNAPDVYYLRWGCSGPHVRGGALIRSWVCHRAVLWSGIRHHDTQRKSACNVPFERSEITA